MRTDAIQLGRDYRLRYARPGHYRVRAIAWSTMHRPNGTAIRKLRVEWREEDTGGAYDGIESEVIWPSEISGPWPTETDHRHDAERDAQASTVALLRLAFARHPKIGGQHVDKKRGSRTKVVVELSAADGETLARLLDETHDE